MERGRGRKEGKRRKGEERGESGAHQPLNKLHVRKMVVGCVSDTI